MRLPILNQIEANIRAVGRQERAIISQPHFELFIRFPDLRPDISEADLQWRDTPLFRALTHLPLVWG